MLKLRSWQLGASVLAVIFGGVLLTSAFGWWQTESTKEPVKYESGDAAGEYNPVDIRGSYTFGEISALFEIPYEDLAAAFRLPEDADPAVIACKDLEEMYLELANAGTEIGTASVRLFVSFYRGLPYEPDEETFLLRPAAQILKRKAALTEEQLAYLDAHTVDLQASANTPAEQTGVEANEEPPAEAAESTPVVPVQDHEAENERMVKGPTTFREILDWGVPQETIEQIIGGPIPNPLIVVKDYCLEQGLSFSEIKIALQEAVDTAGE